MNMEDMIRRLTDMENEAKTLNEAIAPVPGLNTDPSTTPAPAPTDTVAPGAGSLPSTAREGNPVSINVSLNASGKEHVEDLLGMMKNAGLGNAQEVSPDMMPMRQDMERLRSIVDEPDPEQDDEPSDADNDGEDDDDLEPSVSQEEIGTEEDLDEYDNEPEPEYQDHKYMTRDLSGGLNREKKAYADAEDGDNPMAVHAEAIKLELMKALGEKRASEEDQVDEISADALRRYRDKAQDDMGAKQKDLRSRVPAHKIPQGDDAKLDRKIKDRGEQKSKAIQKIMKKDPTPAPKRGEKYPLGGRDSKSGRSYSS